jgi:tetratricopeptide (TPR) repeat protein
MRMDSPRDRRRPLMIAGATLIIGLALVLTFRSGTSKPTIPVMLPVAAKPIEVLPAIDAPPPVEVAVRERAEPVRPTPSVARRHAVAHHTAKAKHPIQRGSRATRVSRRLAMAKPEPAPSRAEAAPADAPDPRASYERGNARLFAGENKGAIAAYREAVKQAPNDPIGYRGLGLAYEQKGDTKSALKALRYYLKLAPSAPDRDIVARRIERLAKLSKRK